MIKPNTTSGAAAGAQRRHRGLWQRFIATISGLAIAAGGVSVAQAEQTQAPIGTETEKKFSLAQQCVGIEWTWSFFSYSKNNRDAAHMNRFVNGITQNEMSVTYPDKVLPGQDFQVTVSPGRMGLKSGAFSSLDLGRIKYDVMLPNNVVVKKVEAGPFGDKMPGSPNAFAQRIDQAGNPDANGPIVRVYGGYTVSNGPHSALNTPKAGLRVQGNNTGTKPFTLPSLTVTMTAPEQLGAQVSLGLRASDEFPQRKGANNFLSFAIDGGSNEDYWCAPKNAGRISTTTVAIDSSEIALSGTDAGVAITSGDTETPLTATVTTSAEESSVLEEGTVEFLHNGEVIGNATVDAEGTATLLHTFPELENRTPVSYDISARFTGVDGKVSGSATTRPLTVTVNPVPLVDIPTSAELNATRGALDGDQYPVELEATIIPSNGKLLPAGSQVTFFRDGTELNTQSVDDDGRASFTDHLRNAEEGSSYSYTVRFGGATDEANNLRYTESTSEPAAVTFETTTRTKLGLAVSSDSVDFGGTVNLTATLTETGGTALPSDQEFAVSFRENGRAIGDPVVVDDAGRAELNDVTLGAGEHAITAHFLGKTVGSTRYMSSKAEAVTVTVGRKPQRESTTEIEVQAKAVHGEAVKLTARVKNSDGSTLPEVGELGKIAFYATDGEGNDSKIIGFGDITMAGGVATAQMTYQFPGKGKYQVYARFSGVDAKAIELTPSVSDVVPVTVSPVGIKISEPKPDPGLDPEDPALPPGEEPDSGSSGSSAGGLDAPSGIEGSSMGDLLWIILGSVGGLVALFGGIWAIIKFLPADSNIPGLADLKHRLNM